MFAFDIPIITDAGPFIERRFGLGALGLGWAFSSLLFGCVLGAASSGHVVDEVGRKPLMAGSISCPLLGISRHEFNRMNRNTPKAIRGT